MAFRKRNVTLPRTAPHDPASASAPSGQAGGGVSVGPSAYAPAASALPPGVRPSPATGQPVTSTGIASLDGILGGHAGLALGCSLLLGEVGTTDYAGVVCRLFAAQGVAHRQALHVVGVSPHWVRELPGVVAAEAGVQRRAAAASEREKMKIAWRYERLGQFGEEKRAPTATASRTSDGNANLAVGEHTSAPFSHQFDLKARLAIPSDLSVNILPVDLSSSNPFDDILVSLATHLSTSSPETIHRLIVPSLLSPAAYPASAAGPDLLCFLHGLRSLLRQNATRLVALLTLPLSLYPRTTGLIRWAEILSDGVLELVPFPHVIGEVERPGKDKEDRPQGMLRVHRLPVFHERGGGAASGLGEDLAFTVSRRKFLIKPFSLPPVEGDTEAQAESGLSAKKSEMEF